jgi:hypothetical protein
MAIQTIQRFAEGGLVRSLRKVLPVAQSAHSVELRDAAEPIQGDKAT